MASHNDVNVPCISWCALCSIAFCGCGYWQWIIQMMQRGDIRRRHGVDGSGAEDCLMSACCSCCALIQEEREMRDPLLMGSGQAVGVQQQQQQPAVNGYQSPEEQAAGMQYKA